MTCAFCKSDAYGCTPGRCFSPRSRAVDEVVKPSAPKPQAPPLGPRRVVLEAHARSGDRGGVVWVCVLDCGHVVWRRAARKTNRPRTEVCFDCSAPLIEACACGCKTTAIAEKRWQSWSWRRRAWWAPGHLERVLRSG